LPPTGGENAARGFLLFFPLLALFPEKSTYNEEARAKELAALAAKLPPTQREQALSDAFVAAKAIRDQERRVKALAALAPHLSPTQSGRALSDALATAKAIRDEESRARALAALAPHLPGPQREHAASDALAAAREAIDDAFHDGGAYMGDVYAETSKLVHDEVLAAVAPHLSTGVALRSSRRRQGDR